MKIKKYSLVLLTSALLLITLVIGCGESYTPEDLDTAREAGYSEGYASGKAEGYSDGYDTAYKAGYEAGKADGYKAGHDKGYDTGKADGYEAGLLNGNKAGYAEGYDAGIIELEGAKQEAEKLGYDKGYEAGVAWARLQAALAELEELKVKVKLPEETLFEDLAYIEAYLWSYTDDADPEAEGIYLRISFYDSKSARIRASGVPITVSFKIYSVSGETSRPTKGYDPLIYQDTVSTNSTMEEIKIPFEKLFGPQYDSRIKTFVEVWLEVTITTPNQEDFSVTSKSGWLGIPLKY